MENTTSKHGYAVASLVLGILSIVLCCCYYIGLVCGIVGLVLSVVAKKNGNDEGINKAGLVLNIIGVSIGAIFVILLIIGAGASQYTYQELLKELQ